MSDNTKLPSLIVRGFSKEMERAIKADAEKLEQESGVSLSVQFEQIPTTVTCAWCDKEVPDDSEAPDGFCSPACHQMERSDMYGRDA